MQSFMFSMRDEWALILIQLEDYEKKNVFFETNRSHEI